MEKRLIDAEKVIGDLTAMKAQLGVDAILIDGMIDGLKRQPKVDAVEVVRCKDCKHAYINKYSAGSGVVLCRLWTESLEIINFVMNPDDFCAYGERRGDNAAD